MASQKRFASVGSPAFSAARWSRRSTRLSTGTWMPRSNLETVCVAMPYSRANLSWLNPAVVRTRFTATQSAWSSGFLLLFSLIDTKLESSQVIEVYSSMSQKTPTPKVPPRDRRSPEHAQWRRQIVTGAKRTRQQRREAGLLAPSELAEENGLPPIWIN